MPIPRTPPAARRVATGSLAAWCVHDLEQLATMRAHSVGALGGSHPIRAVMS